MLPKENKRDFLFNKSYAAAMQINKKMTKGRQQQCCTGTAVARCTAAGIGIAVITLVTPTLHFGKIQMGLPHSEADIEWYNLLPQDQKVLYQEEFSIYFILQETNETCRATTQR